MSYSFDNTKEPYETLKNATGPGNEGFGRQFFVVVWVPLMCVSQSLLPLNPRGIQTACLPPLMSHL